MRRKGFSKAQVLRDLCLILVIAAAGVVLLVWMKCRGEEGSYALVRCEGVEIGRYPLLSDGTYSLNGGTNSIEIKGGRVHMMDADCPDRLCINQGWVHFTGQCLTCLPNRLTVTVVGGDDSVDLVL